MAQPKILRELQLLMYLAGNKYSTIDQICERFGFTERTFYRYIDTYREAGFVVKKNGHGVYRLETSGSKLSKHLDDLLHFSEEETAILYKAIDTIEPDTHLREQLKRKLYAVYDYKVISDTVYNRKNAHLKGLLSKAMEEKRLVVLKEYRSAHSNTTSDRLVEPYRFTDAGDQVWCYEIESSKVKTFKISRIDNVHIQEAKWSHEADHQTGYVDIFRMHSVQHFPVRLRLSLRAANLLMEEYPLSAKCITQQSNNRYLLETEVCGLEGVGRFVLGLYDDVEVLMGDDLKAFLQYKIKMMKV